MNFHKFELNSLIWICLFFSASFIWYR